MPGFLYKERDAYKSFNLVARDRGDGPEEKRPSTAQKKKAEEESDKPIQPPRPPTAKNAPPKPDVPDGFLKTYFNGIMGAPTYVPKDSFFLDHSKPGKPVMRINMENSSKFIQGKQGE